MENLDHPLPPKSRMGRWRVFTLRATSSLICGGWGFAVPFYFVQDCSNALFPLPYWFKPISINP